MILHSSGIATQFNTPKWKHECFHCPGAADLQDKAVGHGMGDVQACGLTKVKKAKPMWMVVVGGGGCRRMQAGLARVSSKHLRYNKKPCFRMVVSIFFPL